MSRNCVMIKLCCIIVLCLIVLVSHPQAGRASQDFEYWIPSYQSGLDVLVHWWTEEEQVGWKVEWDRIGGGAYHSTGYQYNYDCAYLINFSGPGHWEVWITVDTEDNMQHIGEGVVTVDIRIPDNRFGIDGPFKHVIHDLGSGGTGYVNVSNGNLVIQKTDYVIPNPKLPFELTRTYNQLIDKYYYEYDSVSLVPGWRFNYDMILDVSLSGWNYVVLIDGDGGEFIFTGSPMRDIKGRLFYQQSGAYFVKDRDGTTYAFDVWIDDGVWVLTEIEDRWGNTITINRFPSGHNYAGKINQIIDAVGNTITFNYDSGTWLLDYIEFPGNRFVKYEYDLSDMLIEVYDPTAFGSSIGNIVSGYTPTSYMYNWEGLVKVTNSMGDDTTYVYSNNKIWKVQQEVTDIFSSVNTHITEFDYPIDPYKTRVIYPNQHERIFTYAEYGKTTEELEVVSLSGENVTRSIHYIYNEFYDITGITETYERSSGNKTEYIVYYRYDDNNNVISKERWEVDSNGFKSMYSCINYTYEYTGNNDYNVLTSKTDELGRVTRYYYDGSQPGQSQNINTGNLTLVTISSTPTAVQRRLYEYGYDESGYVHSNSYLEGLLTTKSVFYDFLANTYDTHYTYNQYGFLSKEERQIDNAGVEFSVTNYSYSRSTGLLDSKWRSGDNLSIPNPGEQPETKIEYYHYNKTGRLTAMFISYAPGFVYDLIYYQYDRNGNMTLKGHRIAQVGAEYQITEYQYDELNRVKKIIDPLGYAIKYQYDEIGNKIYEKDRDGNITTYTYDELRNLISRTVWDDDAEYRATRYIYNTGGNLYEVLKPDGSSVRYTYDGLRRITQKTERIRLGGSIFTYLWRYHYNRNDTIMSVTDPKGHVTTNNYDMFDNISSKHYPDGKKWSFFYDYTGQNLSGKLYNLDGTLGTYESYKYDGLGRLIDYDFSSKYYLHGFKNETFSKTEYTYYSDGPVKEKIVHIDDSNTRVTEYYYDILHNVTKERTQGIPLDDGLELVTTYTGEIVLERTYDLLGNMLTEIDARGHETTYIYDKRNLLERIEFPDSGYIDYEYTGNMLIEKESVYYSKENEIDLTYDSYYSYTPLGNIKSIEYPDGGMELYTYYPTGRLKDKITLVNCDKGKYSIITYEYDGRGSITKVIMSPDFAKLQAEGIIKLPLDARKYVTEYRYDRNGNLIRQVDARGNITIQGFDSMNRLAFITDPLGNSVEYLDYDYFGNYLTLVNRNGETVSYIYDKGGRLEEINAPNETLSYKYDWLSNITEMTDSTGIALYGYYPTEWLEKVEYPYAMTIKYTYDASGNMIGEKMFVTGYESTTSEIILREYDSMNRLIEVIDGQHNVTEYTYDPVGRRKTLYYEVNGVTSTYEYDARNRLVKLTNYANYEEEGSPNNVKISSFTYDYDKTGNIVAKIEDFGTQNERTTTYTYDAMNRLTKESYPNGSSLEYGYDEVGNRTALIELNEAGELIRLIRYSYNAANQLISEETLQ